MFARTRTRFVVLLFGGALAASCLPPGVERFSEADMTAPVLVKSPPFEPPRGAATLGQEGIVEIECIITRDGNPEACRIEHDLPGGLGHAVLQMVQQQRYAPALRDTARPNQRLALPRSLARQRENLGERRRFGWEQRQTGCVRRAFFSFKFPRPDEEIVVKYPITLEPG